MKKILLICALFIGATSCSMLTDNVVTQTIKNKNDRETADLRVKNYNLAQKSKRGDHINDVINNIGQPQEIKEQNFEGKLYTYYLFCGVQVVCEGDIIFSISQSPIQCSK